MKRLKILVSAFSISPDLGSEPGVGWAMVTKLTKYHDITVLYGDIDLRHRSRRRIEKWLANHGEFNGLKFCYVPQTKTGHFFLKVAHHIKPLRYIYYNSYKCWQREAYAKALALLKTERFDAVHHLTVSSYREPGYLWKLPIPFFWGPINGADNVPWAFFSEFSRTEKYRYGVRNILNLIQRNGWGRMKAAARAAKKVWVVSEADFCMVTSFWGKAAERMPVTGTMPDLQARAGVRRFNGTRPLRLVWSGIHEGRKSLPLLIKALARLNPEVRVDLTVLGDGTETNRWKKLANHLQVNGFIKWKGRVPLPVALSIMNQSDILVHTSIKEGTPTVIMEALSMGLPVLCHDACGMAPVVDESCGLKIPLRCPETSVHGFTAALEDLWTNPQKITALSRGALAKAAALTWENNAKGISESYEKFCR